MKKSLIHESYNDFLAGQLASCGNHKKYINKFNNIPEINKKCAWLAESFEITTYDLDISIEFGMKILEVMKVIWNNKNFKYIDSSPKKYRTFLAVCQLLNYNTMIEWGTSIRGCWFDYHTGDGSEEDMKFLLEEFMK